MIKIKQKTCRVCGELFMSNSSRQLDCGKEIISKCAICGKEFVKKCSINDKKVTCSNECMIEYRKNKILNSYSTKTVKCVLCGKEFHPVNNTQKYCKKMHEVDCVVCGKEFIVDTSKQDKAKTCSKECANKLRFRNGNPLKAKELREKWMEDYRQRTGYSHPMHNPDVVKKMRDTSLKRYGETSFTKTKEYIDKCKETNNLKYGVDWHTQNKSVRNKITDTWVKNYGVDNPMKSEVVVDRAAKTYFDKTGYNSPLQNPEVRSKIEKTNLERYGTKNAISSEYVKQKRERTLLDRYGVDNALKNESIKNKMMQTTFERYGHTSYLASEENRKQLKKMMQSKYGTDFYSQTTEWKRNRVNDPEKVELWDKFIKNPDTILCSYQSKPTIEDLKNDLGVSYSTVCFWVIKLGIQDKVQYVLSKMENEVVDFIKNLDYTIKIIRHDRKTIEPYELDIYLPDFKIGIECNPTSTHNSSIPSFEKNEPIPYNYHKMKSDLCEKNGVFLFHIFGYEWTHKRGIIESMIRNLLGKNEMKFYARNSKVKRIDNKMCDKFLEENHRQGSSKSPIRYGAFVENELVSVMTFSKLRPTISKNGNDFDFEHSYELVRFCSKKNTNVIGVASKLFKKFIVDYSPEFVVSYSDRSHTMGGLYQKLGFVGLKSSKPNYVWVDSNTDLAYHRMNTQKRNLKNFLHDDTIDLSKSERQIMIEHGFLQVFDSGTITWVYY